MRYSARYSLPTVNEDDIKELMKALSENMLISNGTLFTMNRGEEPFKASVLIEHGSVSAIFREPPGPDELPGDVEVFDAEGLYVAPGFIDIHIHDENEDARETVEFSMLRQGVTTALSGNCGLGTLFGESEAIHQKAWINLYTLAGNCTLRAEAGQKDLYAPANAARIETMKDLLRESMDKGAMGLSFGFEYAPGTSEAEVNALSAVAAEYGGMITVHTRYDDDRCVDSIKECVGIARSSCARVEISHLGSMTPYHTPECIEIINKAKSEGARLTFDCYPYDAFCTIIGTPIFDDGFVERWRGKGPEVLRALTGRFRGQTLTWDSFREMRREEPESFVAAFTMDRDEVESCIADPGCVIASDTYYNGGGAHPRMSGTFPRGLRIARKHGYSWRGALEKVTTMPADVMEIDAGRLDVGKAADIVVFRPDEYTDKATFDEPFLPPSGVKLVLVGGYPAARDGEVSREPHGALHRRRK
jgi:N-acyl-D-amino-acid deacylase